VAGIDRKVNAVNDMLTTKSSIRDLMDWQGRQSARIF
jgi:hypothetical protein